ncbi:hypothetical protein [Pollutimonas bauzanensis]|uniref:hypothetical protein n=1 Tax=Pollutimonas bauzanensis TaxID=658167 RepID=UPI000933F515|nr:hypothetical protein [Pollutimonas bauzanensis]
MGVSGKKNWKTEWILFHYICSRPLLVFPFKRPRGGRYAAEPFAADEHVRRAQRRIGAILAAARTALSRKREIFAMTLA